MKLQEPLTGREFVAERKGGQSSCSMVAINWR